MENEHPQHRYEIRAINSQGKEIVAGWQNKPTGDLLDMFEGSWAVDREKQNTER